MNMAYLGFWSDPVGWVMEQILDPMFQAIGNLLNAAFSWLFEVILAPLLKSVLLPLATAIAKLIFEMLAGIFYGLMATIWKILDAMEQAYNLYIGVSLVRDTSIADSEPTTLLEALYNIPVIQKTFWFVFIISIVLLFMLTMYSVAKSIFDLETEKPRTVSHVMNSFLRACIQFLLVPLLVLFMIRLSGTLVTTVDNVMSASTARGNSSIGSTLFVISSLDASKDATMNISTASAENRLLIGVGDSVRKDYYLNGKDEPEKTYWNTTQVQQDFYFAKFDYFVGIGVSIFVFFIMVSNSIVFIQRIFDMLLLFIVAPFFVAMMPLDDGERFKRWRELFLGKSVSGIGGVLAMKLYLLLVPVIIGGQITFSSLGTESTETMYVLKVLFLIGGAWAATKSGAMVTGLISSGAGSSETQAADMGDWLAKKTLKAAYERITGSGDQNSQSQNRNVQRVGSGRFNGSGGAGKSGGTEGGTGGKIPGLSDGGTASLSGGADAPGSTGIGGLSGIGDSDADDDSVGFGGQEGMLDDSLSFSSEYDTSEDSEEPEFGTMSAREMMNAQAEMEKAALPEQKTKKFMGFTFKTNRNGKYKMNINMGPLFSNTYGADGSHTMKIAGFQWRTNHRGELDKFTVMGFGGTKDYTGEKHLDLGLPGIWKEHVGADGSRNRVVAGGLFARSYNANKELTNTRNFGVEKQRNTKTGQMYTRRNMWTGLEKVQDKDGGVHVKSHYGLHYAPDANGNYQFTHGWGVSQRNMINENGESECVSRSFMGRQFYERTSAIERMSQLEINQPKE